MESNIYYNMNKLMSYNALYSFVLGERGNGKTYQGKKKMIELFLKKGKQSIYIRRTQTELDKIKDNLFNDISKNYENIDINVKGDIAYINGKIFCYFIALSTSNQYSSASFPDVEFMFFDEYIITKTGRNNYLKNEMLLLNNIVETVFRLRTPKLYICANSLSYVNPFFEFFNIEPKQGDKFITIKNNGDVNVVVEITNSESYREVKKESRFIQMLSGSSFADFCVDNKVLEDSNDFLIPKKPQDFNYFRGAYRIGDKIIGCWSHTYSDDGVWFGENYDQNSNWKYTIYSNQNFQGWRNIKIDRNNFNIIYIKKCYLNGNAYYQNQSIKKMFIEEIAKFL